MHKITVLGLGHGDYTSLTVATMNVLKEADKVYLRTQKHDVVDFIESNGIEYITYDDFYETGDNFEEVYEKIADDLICKAKEKGNIIYAAPGNPLISDKVCQILLKKEKEKEIEIILPGSVGVVDEVLRATKTNSDNSVKLLNALDLASQYVDINSENILMNVYDVGIAADVKLYISEIYGDEYKIFIMSKNKGEKQLKSQEIHIYELDRLDNLNHTSCILIPAIQQQDKKIHNMHDLMMLMEQLRGRNGCPWDRKQTHESLRECVIEEAYEVVEAINNNDIDNLIEELGDLLLQVIFHCQLAKEEGTFNMYDVTSTLANKLVHRHPHVFGDLKAENAKEVKDIWEDVKEKEKDIKEYTKKLEDVPKSLSALIRSYKIQSKAAKVGFDWDDINSVIDKVKEELVELEEAINKKDQDNTFEELGDLLFSIVNLSRFCEVEPELALLNTIDKFIQRFKYIEDESVKIGKDLKEMQLEEMDNLWNEAKTHKISKKDKK